MKYNEDRRSGVISAYKKKESKKKPFDGPVATPPVEAVVAKDEPTPVAAKVVAPVISNEEE